MLHHTLNFGRELQEQLDRQNYIKQDTNERTLKSQTRSFQDEGDGIVGMTIKGEVKGGGTDKTEKEKETAGKQRREDWDDRVPATTQYEV